MKSWALAIALFVASVTSPFSPVRGEAKAEAPKVSAAQPQRGLLCFSTAPGMRSIVTPTFGG
jgi:hypothetical protein